MTQEQLNKIADELEKLQAPCNNGRGIEFLRSVIFYLRHGELDSAVRVAQYDSDKLHFQKDIDTWLGENLPGYESSKMFWDRWNERKKMKK